MSEEVIYKLHRYPSGELEEFEQVQELIRCKDCKKRDTKACSLSWVTEWGEWEIGHCNNDEWYCGDAERREP